MNNIGYIPIDRFLFQSKYWAEKRIYSHAEAIIDLLQTASYKAITKNFNNRKIELQRGQLVASNRFLSARWGWTESRVRRFLRKLLEEGLFNINIIQKINVITVVNYSKFSSDSLNDSPSNSYNGASTNHEKTLETYILPASTNNSPTSTLTQVMTQETTLNINKQTKNKDLCLSENDQTYINVVQIFNKIITKFASNIPPVDHLTDKEKCAIDICLSHEDVDISIMEQAFTIAASNDFLNGRGRKEQKWKANFNWLIKYENLKKVISGKYNLNSNNNETTRTKNRYEQKRTDSNSFKFQLMAEQSEENKMYAEYCEQIQQGLIAESSNYDEWLESRQTD